ncbi:MAG: peptidoglycan DD-metalloendopeptidase family protein [Candidatus Peribacteria bacterium]|nr:MAG: peptidoglycan DD-metalloendopeptidase family protein [Candidatus Peribacteria bacterium]
MKKITIIIALFASLITIGHSLYAQKVESNLADFSVSTARTYQKSLSQTMDRIEQKLASLDTLFPETDAGYDKYNQARGDIVDIIDDMKQTIVSISNDLSLISKYQEDLATSSKNLAQLKTQKEETKQSIERLTRLLYQLHNEIYDQGVVDDIKIFTKLDNITDAANQEIYMELLIKQLDTLMGALESDTTTTTEAIKQTYENKNNLEKQITSYQSNVENIEKKTAYLESYMELLQNNKEAINDKIQDVVNTKTDIENSILTIASDIQQKTFLPTWDWEYQYNTLLNLPNYGAEDIYTISWPVLPITYIKRYFNDASYSEQYGVQHNGIRINIPQGQAVHAARDGIVVHVTENEMGINRVTIAHTDGYTTSYLYVTDIFVREGSIVHKGQVIARSGGESGTKGAGFFAIGSNITFLVTKGGRFIDPLTILDLSAISNEKMIPDDLVFKYRRDIERRPIDLTSLTIME